MYYYTLRLSVFILSFLAISSTKAFEPLPASEVFHYSIETVDTNTALLSFNIKNGFFLYKEKFKFNNLNPDNIKLGTIYLPEGKFQSDEHIGDYYLLYDDIKITLPILGLKAGITELHVDFQGCSDSGFCYPPDSIVVQLVINQALELNHATIIEPTAQSIAIAPENDSERANHLLSQQNLFWIVLSFLGFGLLLTFTPCVLPMVPILSSIIIGQKRPVSTRKAFLLSFTYVLSMSLTYALAGIIVALLGSNLQAAFQQPWLIALFSLAFVFLALSMFGFYELRMPEKIETKIAQLSHRQKHGAYLGTAIMGCFATLLLSPCVTAPLVGVLSYIAQSGDAVIGGVALFAMGMGMGIPLLIIGVSTSKWLPKAGQWMNSVKAFFGVLLLGIAIYLLDRILPGQIIMMLWASLLIISAMYLGTLQFSEKKPWGLFWQGLGIILLTYGVILIIGSAMGNQNLFKPLDAANQIHSNQKSNTSLNYTKIATVAELTATLTEAKQTSQPVVIDFYADWCISCKIMERTVLSDAEVIVALAPFKLIKLDVTKNDADDKALLTHFNAIAPPTFIFINAQGNEIKAARIVGEVKSEVFLKSIRLLQMDRDA